MIREAAISAPTAISPAATSTAANSSPTKIVAARSAADSSAVTPSGALTAPVAHSRLQLTRRGRVVITTLVATPLVALAMVMALNGGMATATATAGPEVVATVTVEAGSSLWEVAETIAPGEDTREVVAQLRHLNKLSSAEVQPGQTLAIPQQYRTTAQ